MIFEGEGELESVPAEVARELGRVARVRGVAHETVTSFLWRLDVAFQGGGFVQIFSESLVQAQCNWCLYLCQRQVRITLESSRHGELYKSLAGQWRRRQRSTARYGAAARKPTDISRTRKALHCSASRPAHFLISSSISMAFTPMRHVSS